MKDLILISSFCNTKLKEETLRNLVNKVNTQKDYFDLMIVSHTTIPLDIQDKCNYVFYDSNNELLYDWDLRSKPWFDPGNERPILSVFTGFYNTHLAIWRMLIIGNSLAKNLGYTKLHHIEYDSIINDFSELYDNSKLLNTHDSVYYKKTQDTVDDILFGTYQAYRLDTLHEELLILNEDKLKSKIRNSKTKSPEGMLQDLLHESKFFIKLKNLLNQNGNDLGLTHLPSFSGAPDTAWCLPFYDKKNKGLSFIVWNMESEIIINVKLIYNQDTVINIGDINKNAWKLEMISPNYDDAHTLTVILNGKIRNEYHFDEYREEFKLNSYREKNKRIVTPNK